MPLIQGGWSDFNDLFLLSGVLLSCVPMLVQADVIVDGKLMLQRR